MDVVSESVKKSPMYDVEKEKRQMVGLWESTPLAPLWVNKYFAKWRRSQGRNLM